jgi:hypothetical protein
MINLPDFNRAFDYENGFYLTCEASRVGKFLAHYELYNIARQVPGDIVECGVFKGSSLARFAMFRQLLDPDDSRSIFGFDMFGSFPETAYESDKSLRADFVKAAGLESISRDQLMDVLRRKNCDHRVSLVAGDICQTVPAFAEQHPDLRIALLNLDTDIYEPAVVILEHFWPKLSSGGVLILDDYNVFPGETAAVDSFFSAQNIEIQRFSYSQTPSYIIKP